MEWKYIDYLFKCECGNKQIVSMRISEYQKNGHKCDKCGKELIRDVSDICSSFSVKCDGFFGKSKQKESEKI